MRGDVAILDRPASPPSLVRIRDLHKRYALGKGSTLAALAGVDLDIARGEVVSIVGGSGCGKSTLLRVIAGLERPERGSVSVGDRVIEGPGPDRGLVFQESRLLPWLSVAQNVAFGVAGRPRAERDRLVVELLERVGLRGFEHAYPHQLSGGMAQRVAIARALAPGPLVLLMDEPFGALDALTRLRMQEELMNIWSVEKTTLALVTHDVEEAIYLADRVVLMSQRPGRIARAFDVSLPRPRERTSPAFAALRRSVLGELLETVRQPELPSAQAVAS